MWQFWFEIVALALLGSYLVVKRRERSRQRLEEEHMTGTAFDAGAVTPRIKQVRQDYLAQLHSKPKCASRRAVILTGFRNAIRRLSYFRSTAAHPDWSDHEEETHKC